jgi:hypothetical protein
MPTIIDQPEDVYINSGQAATFSVAVSSPTPVSYQWYSGYSGDTSYPIDGATGPVYTTPDVFGSGASSVWVRVTNAAGSRDSANAWFNYRYITTVDLLENGDFEAGSSGWTLKNGSADKISCNDKGYESPCAFVFKGGIGEKAKISQTQPLPPASYESRLVLKLDAKTKSTNKPFVVMATVTYSDGKPPMVKKLTYPALSGSAYTRLSDNVTSYGPSDAVEAVTLSIRHKSATGKTFIDEVELQLLQFAGPWRSDGVLPPPDAPEGLRGTN